MDGKTCSLSKKKKDKKFTKKKISYFRVLYV